MELTIAIASIAVLMIWMNWLTKRYPSIEKKEKNKSPYRASSSLLFFITLFSSIFFSVEVESWHIHGLTQIAFISIMFLGLIVIFGERVVRSGSKQAIRTCALSGGVLAAVFLLSQLLLLEMD
jgi:hypothetical protein